MYFFNVFLYLMFAACQQGNPTSCNIYAGFVQNGSPCYAWHGSTLPTAPPPACYDPNNVNGY